ncbi:putative betaine aldehyde dehydrogenase [Thozetella sp. PMI_491]|nr:putative betaine aldehyde dehydrogenase [Thozetella sp. PMI_491]
MASLAGNYKLEDLQTFYNVIDNELKGTAKTRHGINPNTGEPLPEVPVSTQEDVDSAVAAAQRAFPAWRDLSQDQRADYLMKYADAIEANQQELIQLLGTETGKTQQGAGIDMYLTIAQIRGTARHRLTEEIIEDSNERIITQRYLPLGVGAGIIPWNLPTVIGAIKLPTALLAGNTYIWKPSPYAPYASLKMGELAAKIFPKGVVNVLSGDNGLGPMLTAHPDIAMISFTGSVPTGKKIAEACAPTLKRVVLELGGNDAAIICPDVDIPNVISKLAPFVFFHAGQVCMDVKRIFVHEDIYDAFLSAMLAVVQSLKIGPFEDADATLGPVQNAMQYNKLQDLYAEVAKNLKTLPEGSAARFASATLSKGGFFVPPVLVDNPPEDASVVAEEHFGPIVPLLKWSNEEDVIQRANATRFGLGGSVWSADRDRAERMARRLEAGTVWANAHFDLGPQAAFGGHKESGFGVDSGLGGLKGWCNPQAVWVLK